GSQENAERPHHFDRKQNCITISASTDQPPDTVTREAFNKIKLGMTEAEVEAIIQNPYKSSYCTGPLTTRFVLDNWNDGPKALCVEFLFDFSSVRGRLGQVTGASFSDSSTWPPLTIAIDRKSYDPSRLAFSLVNNYRRLKLGMTPEEVHDVFDVI